MCNSATCQFCFIRGLSVSHVWDLPTSELCSMVPLLAVARWRSGFADFWLSTPKFNLQTLALRTFVPSQVVEI